MRKLCTTLCAVARDEQGGEVLEYALIAGLIVVVAISVITSVGGKSVQDASALTSIVDSFKPGDSVQVKVSRNGQTKTFTVKLGQRPDSTQSAQQQQEQPQAPQQTQPDPGFGGGW